MNNEERQVWCCACGTEVWAIKVTGKVIYPHRKDLYDKEFWQCDCCKNYVGCHKADGRPLGSIPGRELRRARMLTHQKMDPLWRDGPITRNELYAQLREMLPHLCRGHEFHTGELRTIEEAREAYRAVNIIAGRINAERRMTQNPDLVLTIEPVKVYGGEEEWAVYSHDTYPENSVLHGQPRRMVVLAGQDLEVLKGIYPKATVLDHSTKTEPYLPETPPDWFDPAAAGEEW